MFLSRLLAGLLHFFLLMTVKDIVLLGYSCYLMKELKRNSRFMFGLGGSGVNDDTQE